jgi:3-oxoacyl-[acyl-carrier protein] reductase
MDLGLSGKVAVVAGASRGIGLAIARSLGLEGSRLVLVARGEEALTRSASDLEALGLDVHPVVADVAEPGSEDRIVAEALRAYDRVDAYIGNAGGNRRKPFVETTDEDWREIFNLNVLSHLRCGRRIAREMVAQGSGALVFVSSIFGREAGGKGLSIYNTTKSALISAAKIMSLELAGSGIRVNSVAPGSIRFPGGSWDRRCIEQPKEMEEFVRQNLPIGRFGTAEEVADVVTFLVSDRASLVTGACLNVDGGQSHSLI